MSEPSPWSREAAEASGWTAGTSTLPPSGNWIVTPPPPAPPAPPAGGWGPPTTPFTPTPTPPPPAPDRRWTGWRAAVALIVVFALAALVSGPLRPHSGGSTSLTSPTGDLITPSRPSPTSPASPPQQGSTGTIPPQQGSAGSAPSANNGTTDLSSADVSAIGAKVNKSVVIINTVLGFNSGRAAGTGMVLTSNGQVLTNNHVIKGSTKITATVVGTGKTYTAHVIGTAPTEDVAVIQLDGASGLTTITASKANVSVGDPVVASGNAGGRGTPTVTSGNVTDVNQTITATDDNGGNPNTLRGLIEFDAPIAQGDSGGPLANANGEIVGMDSAAQVSGRRNSTSTYGYAITIARALDLAGQITSGKKSATVHIGLPAFLGVSVARTNTTGRAGALLSGVEPGLPADDIGLQAGDTITAVDGGTVDSGSSLGGLLTKHSPGDQVTIDWVDSSGAHHSAKATLVEGPAD